ncbi:MAG: polysaccharide biosynthesis tyrosine autokinase [Caulobacterales bacterium]
MNVPRKIDGIQRQVDPRDARLDARSDSRLERHNLRRETNVRGFNESDDEGEGIDIKGLMRFFLRRRWVMMSVGALVAAIVVVAVMLQAPKYSSVALLMVSPQESDLVMDSDKKASQPDAGALESQIEILQSRKLAGNLADRLKLANDPDWNTSLRPSRLETLFGIKPKPKPKTKLTKMEREQLIDGVTGALQARRKGLTYVIEVIATSPDPKLSARMASTLVDLYFESQLQMKLDASRSANAWLSERLGLLKTEVQQKEAAVEAYRASSGLLTASGASLTEQQITGLQSTVIQARTDLAEREARYQQVQALIRSGGNADSIAGVINSETIRVLRAQEGDAARRQADLESRYGNLHPAIAKARVEREGIQAQIQAEIARISANLKNEVDVSRARLATLLGNQHAVQGELVSNNSGMVKLRELERDAGATRAIYESFLKRYQELTESESLKVTDASLVSPATPPTGKSSPRLSVALLLGFALGACIGGAVGLCIDLMDEGLDNAKAVEAATGKPILASIPVVHPPGMTALPKQTVSEIGGDLMRASTISDLRRVGAQVALSLKHGNIEAIGKKRAKHHKNAKPEEPTILDARRFEPSGEGWNPAMYLVEKPMSAFAEGLRSLRTSLLYTGLERRVKVVAVTSAMPGEGKTTTSICLTRVAGLSGQRTIVVECDLRRRSLNGVLGLKPERGILQVLRGETTWQEALIVDPYTGVHVLPAIEETFTPWDVFGSHEMRSLLDTLSEQYDMVVLDCPPVLAVAETRIICRLADETVLVVRWAQTPARAANGAIELIEQCGGNVIGIAINCVDPKAPGRGSYGDVTFQARYAGEYYQS